MSEEFNVDILTPGRVLLRSKASAVVIPAFDGERMILAHHANFIGKLGTGVLKVVKDGNDHWYMISGGVFEITGGKLTVLTELGEGAAEANVAAAKEQLPALEKKVFSESSFESGYDVSRLAYERAKARVELHRRTAELN